MRSFSIRTAAAGVLLAAGLLTLPALAASSSTARASGDIPIRSGPGGAFRIIGTLPDDTRVHLRRCTSESRWCLIIFDHGPDGWVRGSYLVGSPAKLQVTPHKFLTFDPLDPIPDPFDDD